MSNITVSFVDCCLPDYFGGHHLPVLQCPVGGSTTRKELCDSLISELHEGYCDYTFQEQFGFELPYEEVEQAIKDCIFWNGDCKDSDILFPSLEIWPEEEDGIESCYAFFVVSGEEEESE